MAKEEVLIDIQIDEGESVESINSLRAAVKEMTKARNDANLSTVEGRAQVQSLNQAIDANNAKIKANVDALNKQRLNVGSYKKDIQEAIPALDKFTGGAASGAQGLLAMTKQALAFIATPLGAILAAVAATIGLVSAALKRSEPALDLFEDVIGSITESARFLVDNLASIASVIGNVLVGNFAQATAGANALADGFAEVQKEAQRLREEFRELEDEEAKLIANTAGTEAQIKALIIQSKNRNLSEAERIELLKQAEALEKSSTQKKVAFENRRSAATIEQIGNERDLRRAQDETIDAYVQRLIASEKLSGEEKKAVAEAYAARVNASTATLALQEKIQNQQDAAFAKQEQDAQQRSQVAREREVADSEFRLSLLRQEVDQQKALLDELKAYADYNSDAAILKRSELNEQLSIQLEEETVIETEADIKRNQAALERLKKRKDDELFLTRFTETAKLGIVSGAAGQFSKIVGKQTAEGKVLASIQAGVDTYAGANAQLKLPFPYNLFAVATTIATGVANIAEINKFEKGGLLNIFNDGGVLKGASHAQGGIPFSVGGRLGFEAEGGEAIINKRSTAMFKPLLSRINAAGGGVQFADGGIPSFPSSVIDSAANSGFDLSRLEQTISSLKIYTAIEDVNDGQKNYAQVTERAQF